MVSTTKRFMYLTTVDVIVTPSWLKSSMQKLWFTYKGLRIILDL